MSASRVSGRIIQLILRSLFCLIASASLAGAAQVDRWVITNVNPLAGGSCTVRDMPPSVTLFRLTDASAYVWFILSGVQRGDTVRAEWIDPSEQVRQSSNWATASDTGTFCYSSAPLRIAGAVPPLTPGTWKVRVLVNGVQMISGSFTIFDTSTCVYTVTPTEFTFERTAGNGSITIATDLICSWTATASASWIYIVSGTSGSGNATVRFTVAENTGTAARAGKITVAGQDVTITQRGTGGGTAAQVLYYRMLRTAPSGCNFTDPPPNVTSFLASEPEAYLWLVVDNLAVGDVVSWQAYTPAAVRYDSWGGAWPASAVAGRSCFTSPALRIAGTQAASTPGLWLMMVWLNGQAIQMFTFSIQQASTPLCSYSVSPASQSVPAEGGTFAVTVSTAADCQWTATSSADWITIQSGASGRGGGTVGYRVAANSGSSSRSSALSIAGQTVTVTQSGAVACTFALDPLSATVPAAGGTGATSVRTASSCRWTAVSNTAWLSVTSGASGTGNGTVGFSAGANPETSERNGTMTIAGLTFTVRQSAGNRLMQAVLSTVAGAEWWFPKDEVAAVDAPLGPVEGTAVDAAGNLYIADSGNCMIQRIAPNGVLSVVAGNGTCAYAGDGGQAASASLDFPTDVQVDADGSLYVADFNNSRIRKIAVDGTISTLAGTGANSTTGDGGPAAKASVGGPYRLALDAAGNLYAVTSQRVRRISRDGVITTVAGNGQSKFSGDGGPATEASFSAPQGVACDASGNLFVSDWTDNRIRIVTPDGLINTFAGDGQRRFTGDGGPASKASFYNPSGLAMDSKGNLYVADSNNRRIRRIGQDGTITSVAGNGELGYSGDGGPATEASLFWPHAVAVDPAGNVFVADTSNGRLRAVAPDGTIRTVAGNGRYRATDDGSPALSLYVVTPRGFARDAQGNTYIADTGQDKVWKISPDGLVALSAGRGAPGCCADGGLATAAFLSSPSDVAVDSQGNVYIADSANNRIRKVDPDGKISTYAGTGTRGSGGDGGPADRAQLNWPVGLAFDSAGNLYIADVENHRVRKVAPDGTIVTVAGTGESGYAGDSGTATNARMYYPLRVAVDQVGNLFIADKWNNRIRKVTPAGVITTVAGNGVAGYSGDGGPATQARLNYPEGVAVDQAGNIYVADSLGHRIRIVAPDGTITTLAGNGKAGFSGDGGPGTSGSLNQPVDLELSGDALYILDQWNNRLRVLRVPKP